MIRYAKTRGFTEEGMTGGGHWRLRHHSGAPLIMSATPSGSRWRQNVRNTIDKIARSQEESK